MNASMFISTIKLLLHESFDEAKKKENINKFMNSMEDNLSFDERQVIIDQVPEKLLETILSYMEN